MTLKYRYTPIIVFFTLILFFGTISTDSFAAPSDKGKEKGKALGCEKGTAKNNKHCGNGSLPDNTCDTITVDGVIDATELALDTAVTISDVETLTAAVNGDTGISGVIDTADEFAVLQVLDLGACLP